MKMTTAIMVAMGLAAPAAFAQSVQGGPMHDMPGMQMQPGTQLGSQQYQPGGQEQPSTGSEAGSAASSGASGELHGASGPQFNGAPDVAYAPQEKTQNGVSYVCGGIGKDEVAYMKQQAANYDMMLTFAARNGDYLADVDVEVKDARGNPVLQTRCDAPMMLIDLPQGGTYRVHAETGGYSLNRTAHVTAGRSKQRVARVAMVWPQSTGAFEGPQTATGGSATGGTSRSGSGGQGLQQPDYQRGENGYSPRDRMYQDNQGGANQ